MRVLLLVAALLGAVEVEAGGCPTITCGVPVTTTIEVAGDVHCYEFAGTAGDVVSIAESEPPQPQFNTCWRLRRPDNAIVITQCNGQLNVTLPTTGLYTIDVYDNSSSGTGDATGTYSLGYAVVSDSPAGCAAAIGCGATLSGSLSAAAESDLYEFSAQAGEVVSVVANDVEVGVVAGFELYSPTGVSLAKSTSGLRTVEVPDTGTYTIRVFENGEDGTVSYNLSFAIVSPTVSGCATAVGCGPETNGTIDPRTNIDTFELTTTLADETVRVSTTGAVNPFQPCWTVFAASGPAPTAAGTPTPVCGQADAVFPNAGTHVLRVADLGDDATGSYGLGLTCLGTPTPTMTPPPTPTETSTLTPTATETVEATTTETPTPTLTPTATSETPTPTPTPTAEETASPTPSLTPTLTAAVTPSATPQTNPTATPVGPPQGLADPRAAKAAVRCQKAVLAANAKLVTSRLKRLEACTMRALGCVQSKPGELACRDKVGVACARGLDKLAADEAKMRATIAKACAVLAPTDRGSAAGLGFDTPLATCAEEDVVLLAGCIAARARCHADGLAAVKTPRSGELLRIVGAALEPAACLEDFGGVGGGAGDPKSVGAPLVKCAKGAAGAMRTLASARLARTTSCVNGVFSCIQGQPGDATCIAKAAVRCGGDAAKIVAAEAKLAVTLDKRCRAIPFVTLASALGLNLTALDAVCTGLGVGPASSLAAYQECVRRAHACETASVVALAAPRAGEMLLQVQRPLSESFCPIP